MVLAGKNRIKCSENLGMNKSKECLGQSYSFIHQDVIKRKFLNYGR